MQSWRANNWSNWLSEESDDCNTAFEGTRFHCDFDDGKLTTSTSSRFLLMRSKSIFSVFWLTSRMRSLDGAAHPLELHKVGPNTKLNQNLDLFMSSTSLRERGKKMVKIFNLKFTFRSHWHSYRFWCRMQFPCRVPGRRIDNCVPCRIPNRKWRRWDEF